MKKNKIDIGIFIILMISIVSNLIIYSPYFLNEHYVSSHDSLLKYSHISKAKDPSLFPEDRMADIYYQFIITSKPYTYLIIGLNKIFDIGFIYNIILPIFASFCLAFIMYNIGKKIEKKNSSLGIILGILTIVYLIAWSEIIDEQIFGMIPLLAYIYYTLDDSKYKDIARIISIIATSIFYPSITILLLGAYSLEKLSASIKKSGFKDIIRYGIQIILTTLICYVIISSSLNLEISRVNNEYAKTLPEFNEGGFNPIYYENTIDFMLSSNSYVGIDIFSYFGKNLHSFGLILMLFIITATINRKNISELIQELKKERFLLYSGGILYIISMLTLLDLPLYAPGRYFRFAMLPLLLIATGYNLNKIIKLKQTIKIPIIFFIITLTLLPHLIDKENLCPYSELYDYVETLPKDSIIAANPADMGILDCIPLHSNRKVITAYRFSNDLIFYKDLHKKDKEINLETLDAYYAKDLTGLDKYCKKYNITHMIINKDSLKNYQNQNFFEPYGSYIKNKSGNFILLKQFENGKLLEDSTLSVIRC